jgi:hypothetical protein
MCLHPRDFKLQLVDHAATSELDLPLRAVGSELSSADHAAGDGASVQPAALTAR